MKTSKYGYCAEVRRPGDLANCLCYIYKRISEISEKMRIRYDFRFADQIKAAAGSVMDNIAEGFERSSRFEFLNSLSISKGECGELKSQLHRILCDKYIDDIEFRNFILK